LKKDFMEPLDLNASRLSKMLSVPANRICDIIRGRRAITADTAFRLAKCFGTSAKLWMNLQSRYELEKAQYERVPELVEQQVVQAAS